MWAAQGTGSLRGKDLLITAPRFAKPVLIGREAVGCGALRGGRALYRASETTYVDNIFYPVLET